MKRLVLGLSVSLLLLGGSAAQAGILTYTATLNGTSEEPSNNSPGTGQTTVIIDDIANTMTINARFSNLRGTTSAAHLHCCTPVPFAGVAGVVSPLPTFPGFPLGVTAGSYSQTFNLLNSAFYNPAFVTSNGNSVASARLAFLAGLDSGRTYLNIHTSAFPGGEIRGFLTEVPEPGSLALFGLGALGLASFGRRRTPLAVRAGWVRRKQNGAYQGNSAPL